MIDPRRTAKTNRDPLPVEVPDDELDEQAALAATRRERQRKPARRDRARRLSRQHKAHTGFEPVPPP
jgi:hypothetical protein